MQKLVKKEGESAKASVRGVRRDILDSVKKLASEDEQKRLEKQVSIASSEIIFLGDMHFCLSELCSSSFPVFQAENCTGALQMSLEDS